MKERTIVQNILKFLNGLDECYARKVFSSNFTANLPDIIACYRGHFVALEVKRPGQKLTKLQDVELHRWLDAGGSAFRVDCVEDVKAIIHKITEDQEANDDILRLHSGLTDDGMIAEEFL